MLSVKKCKKILEESGKKYSDEEVKRIRATLYIFGEIVTEIKKIKADEKMGR